MISEALTNIKMGQDSKMQKNSSLARLSQSVGPKRKFEAGMGSSQNTFTFAVT